MKKNKVLLLIFLLLISLLFNCDLVKEDEKTDDDEKEADSLIGYWKSSWGDGFKITSGTPKVFRQYDFDGTTTAFEGNIVNNPNLSASNGYITVQITDSGSWGYSGFTVISWKNFSGSGVSESTPYIKDKDSYLPTQNEAEAEFTIEKGYFSGYGDYLRQ